MRVKELNNKLARIAWSPYNVYPSYIACATAAEQSDLTVGMNSSLDLLQLDLSNPGTDLEVVKSVNMESRCAKLIWSQNKTATSLNAKNLLITGCDNTKIYLYDSELVLASNNREDTSCLVQTLENHQSGSINALDLNPFQNNLLASGASSSEIFIWDLNNPATPMTPGTKMQPLDDVNCVSWNNQVQHILASTCSGRCVVWDLRKNESIIKISENMSKLKAKLVSWHPEIATQICLSSDDDHTPFLQLWDLRFATSPVRVLEGHQRGILNFSWCSMDPNLLISSAKDNRIICWNPNNATTNGEILYDLPTSGQWCFDISWCHRNPDLICASSYEGQINVYSLMGGKFNVMHQTSSKIMDSFGVMDSSNRMMLPQTPPSIQQQTIPQLKIAPKWMKRPCGVSFAFGGKLVTFASQLSIPQEQQDPAVINTQRVFINQVVTDLELVDKSHHLESTLQTGNLIEYCNYKVETAAHDTAEHKIWEFILASFADNKHEKFVQLLGFDNDNLTSKLQSVLNTIENNQNNGQEADSVPLADELNNQFGESLHINNGFDSSVFDQIKLNAENVEIAESNKNKPLPAIDLNFNNDTDNLLSESLALGNVTAVVDLCIKENRYTEAILVASCFDDKELFAKAQRLFFQNNESKFSKLLEKVLNRDWNKIVAQCNLNHWKETLSLIMTYTRDQELSYLCDSLGMRLETLLNSDNSTNLLNACICYVCSGNLENFVSCWEKLYNKIETNNLVPSSSAEIQNLVEKIVTLKYCYNRFGHQNQQQSLAKLNSKMVQYAKLLADQGCFLSAYNYLMNDDTNDASIMLMKDRIFNVIDPSIIQQYKLRKPESPFFKPNQQQQQYNQQSISRKSSYYSNQEPQHSPRLNPSSNQYSQTGLNAYKNSATLTTMPQPQTTAPFKPAPINHPIPQTFFPPSQPTVNAPFVPTQTQIPSLLSQPPQQQQNSLMSSTSTIFTPFQPQQPVQQSQTPQMPSYMNTKPPVAWNDPPIVTPKVKQTSSVLNQNNEMPTFFQPTISTSNFPPMMGQQPPSMYLPQQFNPNPQYQNPIQQPPTGYMNYNNVPFNPQQPQKPISPAPSIPQAAAPEPIIEKGPIPPENQIIQSVFDGLLNKCMNITNGPTAKRKLEDVSKKLDVLYDKLRASGESAQQQLSSNVVQGIHSIVQHMQISDYQSSLNLHSSLVATSNFSETSAFLTGIKVLIQQCQQANIRL